MYYKLVQKFNKTSLFTIEIQALSIEYKNVARDSVAPVQIVHMALLHSL